MTKTVITKHRQVVGISADLVGNRLKMSGWFDACMIQFKAWYNT